jgi:hypothetical protein
MIIDIYYDKLEQDQDDILKLLTESLPNLDGILNLVSENYGFLCMVTEPTLEDDDSKVVLEKIKAVLSVKYPSLTLTIDDE